MKSQFTALALAACAGLAAALPARAQIPESTRPPPSPPPPPSFPAADAPPALGYAADAGNAAAAPATAALRRRADFAVFTVFLASEARDVPTQLADLRTLRQQVAEALRAAGAARVDASVESIGGGGGDRWVSGGGSATGGGWSGLVSSLQSYSGPVDLAQLRVLFALKPETDLLELMQRVQGVVQAPRKPERLRVSAGGMTLAVLEPEQYRGALLTQIERQLQAAKSALGNFIPPAGGELRVSGLESPVLVREAGGPWVDLFLPFSFTLAGR